MKAAPNPLIDWYERLSSTVMLSWPRVSGPSVTGLCGVIACALSAVVSQVCRVIAGDDACAGVTVTATAAASPAAAATVTRVTIGIWLRRVCLRMCTAFQTWDPR